MDISRDWPRLIFVEILVVCIGLFAVNFLVDFLDFSSRPTVNIPTPYFPHVFQGDDPTNAVFIKKFWAEILFFSLVFFGQIAIFRLRKNIFTPHLRNNG
jgi:hypothetical protein